MTLAAALIYWVIVALWLAVLAAIAVSLVRDRRTFGTTRLLLAVLSIDTLRNVAENLYFGLYFGAQYGLFPGSIVSVLGNPKYLIIPKIVNVVAGSSVLGLLVLRWLPLAQKERTDAAAEIEQKTAALNRETEERQRLFETSLDLILVTDRRGILTRVSPSSFATIGYRPEEMIGRVGAEFICPHDLDRTRAEMRLARSGRHTRNFKCRYVHRDGRIVPLEWSGVWSEPEQRHFFFGRDMTERQAAEAKLWQLAHIDRLTQLPNRVSLQAALASLLSNGDLTEQHTLALIGIDGLKQISDTLGDTIGERLLCEAARRVVMVAGDCAYRLEGNEFALLIRACADPLVADRIVEDIIIKLSEPFEIESHELFITASAGIAIAQEGGSGPDSSLANADLALFDAKAAVRRRIRHFVPAMRAKAESRRALENELRRACANHEFELFFQPQIRASDSAVVGAEALLRWHHPKRGVLAPGAFIDALCQSSVSLEVGRWILTTACQTAASWRAKGLGELRVAVNLFPIQFSHGTLVRDVKDALDASGLPANLLELEITENIALGQDETLLSPLSALRQMGVSIAFDDFGTGYASLSCLTSFPLTRIKIDRGFVQKVHQAAEQNSAIVRTILGLAKNLGLEVTAEGVETPEQAAFLRAAQCQELQGFLFSRPVPNEQFERLLASPILTWWDSSAAVQELRQQRR